MTQIRQRKQNKDLIKIVNEQIYSKLFLQHCSGIAAFTPAKSQTAKHENTCSEKSTTYLVKSQHLKLLIYKGVDVTVSNGNLTGH